MKNLLFGILAIAFAVAGSAFTSFHAKSPKSIYYLALVGSNYITTSSSAPTAPLCTNTHSDICDGRFNSDQVNVVDNHNGTFTYTPKPGATLLGNDYKN